MNAALTSRVALHEERAQLDAIEAALVRVQRVVGADIHGFYRGPSEDLQARRELHAVMTAWLSDHA